MLIGKRGILYKWASQITKGILLIVKSTKKLDQYWNLFKTVLFEKAYLRRRRVFCVCVCVGGVHFPLWSYREIIFYWFIPECFTGWTVMNDFHLLNAKGLRGLTGRVTHNIQTPESLLTPLSPDSTSTQSPGSALVSSSVFSDLLHTPAPVQRLQGWLVSLFLPSLLPEHILHGPSNWAEMHIHPCPSPGSKPLNNSYSQYSGNSKQLGHLLIMRILWAYLQSVWYTSLSRLRLGFCPSKNLW